MKSIYLVPALAGALLFSTAAMAGEFGNYCAMNLAQGKKVQTDCSINTMIGGKEYCFFDTAAVRETIADVTDTTHQSGMFGIGYHEYLTDNSEMRGTRVENFLADALHPSQ